MFTLLRPSIYNQTKVAGKGTGYLLFDFQGNQVYINLQSLLANRLQFSVLSYQRFVDKAVLAILQIHPFQSTEKIFRLLVHFRVRQYCLLFGFRLPILIFPGVFVNIFQVTHQICISFLVCLFRPLIAGALEHIITERRKQEV